MKELAALAYRDTTAENREFWKNEMGQALREIQQVYDEKLESMRSEMETFYNLKVFTHSLTLLSLFTRYNKPHPSVRGWIDSPTAAYLGM